MPIDQAIGPVTRRAAVLILKTVVSSPRWCGFPGRRTLKHLMPEGKPTGSTGPLVPARHARETAPRVTCAVNATPPTTQRGDEAGCEMPFRVVAGMALSCEESDD